MSKGDCHTEIVSLDYMMNRYFSTIHNCKRHIDMKACGNSQEQFFGLKAQLLGVDVACGNIEGTEAVKVASVKIDELMDTFNFD